MSKTQTSGSNFSRRNFLKTSALVGSTVAGLSIARGAHAAGSDTIKIGLIGCGGRGTGAAGNAMNADKNVKLVAMGDAFADRLEPSLGNLKKAFPEQVDVAPERCFTGLEAYKQVIASGVDVVLLCEPPGFRPLSLKAAIAAGKHVFCEKPVAVDAPGIRSVLESAEQAKAKGLSLVSGLCWRYDPAVCEVMKRILDGAIGDLVTTQVTYNTGSLWHRGKQPDWTEMQYQVRNWYYFAWLSGDHNTEQHVHSLDKAAWAMKDEPPVAAWGLGGRQVRTDAKYGDIYDHHAVVYEYANGVHAYSFCRQQPGCWSDTTDTFFGTKGTAQVLGGFRIKDRDGKVVWELDTKKVKPAARMYVAEHEALYSAIRSGAPINNGVYMARSTMLAILGRTVNYTGQRITWDDMMKSQLSLAPSGYTWDAAPPTKPDAEGRYPVAMPGLTKFV